MVNVGVIGCGYWGPNLIRNFNGLPEANLKTIADLDENRLRQVGLLYPNTRQTPVPGKADGHYKWRLSAPE